MVNGAHLSLYSVHIDWSIPGAATITGTGDSQLIAVPNFNPACNGSYRAFCVPQMTFPLHVGYPPRRSFDVSLRLLRRPVPNPPLNVYWKSALSALVREPRSDRFRWGWALAGMNSGPCSRASR